MDEVTLAGIILAVLALVFIDSACKDAQRKRRRDREQEFHWAYGWQPKGTEERERLERRKAQLAWTPEREAEAQAFTAQVNRENHEALLARNPEFAEWLLEQAKSEPEAGDGDGGART